MDIFKSLDIEDSSSERKRFFHLYLSKLSTNLSNSNFNGKLLPGVFDTLKKLADPHDDYEVYMGLLTGNIEEGARIKTPGAREAPSRLRCGAHR